VTCSHISDVGFNIGITMGVHFRPLGLFSSGSENFYMVLSNLLTDFGKKIIMIIRFHGLVLKESGGLKHRSGHQMILVNLQTVWS